MTGGKFANGATSAVVSYLITAGIQRIAAGGSVQKIRDDRSAFDKMYDRNTKFNEAQEGELIAGANAAKSMLEERLAALNSGTHDAAKLEEMFGNSTPATQIIVKGYIDKELKVLESLSIKNFMEGAECHCKAAYDTSSPMFIKGYNLPIYVNPNAFNTATSVQDMARFLIHELAHLSTVAHMEDYGYGYDFAVRAAREEPRAAIKNADNFSYYVSGLKR